MKNNLPESPAPIDKHEISFDQNGISPEARRLPRPKKYYPTMLEQTLDLIRRKLLEYDYEANRNSQPKPKEEISIREQK